MDLYKSRIPITWIILIVDEHRTAIMKTKNKVKINVFGLSDWEVQVIGDSSFQYSTVVTNIYLEALSEDMRGNIYIHVKRNMLQTRCDKWFTTRSI